MQKQNAQNGESPKQPKKQSTLTVAIIVALLVLSLVAVGVIGNQLVNEKSVRIAFVTTNVLSLMTLAVIVLQTLIYRRQSDIMEGQLIASEQAAEAAYIAQRAYMGVTDVKMMCHGFFPPTTAQIIVGQVPTVYVTWHNGGATPAEHFRAVVYLTLGEKPEHKGYFIDDDIGDMKFNFIPAHKVIEDAPYPQSQVGFPAFAAEMVKQINGGQKRLYAIIDAVYIDFAGRNRELHVEAIYDPFDGIFSDLHQYAKIE
jgi:alkylation response protein AidB-like acyl-CoA dehydrogenase